MLNHPFRRRRMEKQYSTLDIVRILDIPRERLREWLNRGFIRPSIQEAKGPGTKALFSHEDLHRILLFKQLLENGLSRELASSAVDKLSPEDIDRGEFAALGFGGKGSLQRFDPGINEEELKGLAGEVRSEMGAEDIVRLVPRWLRERYGRTLWKAFRIFAEKVRSLTLERLIGRYDQVMLINLKRLRHHVSEMLGQS